LINKNKYSILIILILVLSGQLIYADSDPDRFNKLLGESWYGVYMQGGKAGYGFTTFEKTNYPVDGWKLSERLTLVVSAMGITDTMEIVDERIFSSPNGEMYSSFMKIKSLGGTIEVKGVKEADEFLVMTSVGGQVTKSQFPYPTDYLDSLIYHQILALNGNSNIGDNYRLSIFEPTPPLTGKINLELTVKSDEQYIFNGVPVDAYRFKIELLDSRLNGEFIVDRDGNELLADMGSGVVIKLEPREQAIKLDSDFDILSASIIKTNREIKDLDKLDFAKFLLTGIKVEDLIQTSYQRLVSSESGISLTITKPELHVNPIALPLEFDEMLPFLKSEVYLQSNAPEIIELADKILNGEMNSFKAATLINQWVYENIEKRFTPDFSNALQTLQSGHGDCGEHSALAVTLCRASGIPARPVTGLVYWAPGDGFGYHAWMEVYVGEWLPMDPSWGEDIANPTHIALTTGDIIDQAVILGKVMGKMGIEVLEAE